MRRTTVLLRIAATSFATERVAAARKSQKIEVKST